MICEDDGELFLVSMDRLAVAAAWRALVISAAVGGFGLWISHPADGSEAEGVDGVLGDHRIGRRRPRGRAPTSWMTGSGRQPSFGVQDEPGLSRPLLRRRARVARSDRRLRSAAGPVGELHQRSPRQARPHGEDVGVGSDLRGRDVEGRQELRGGHEDGPDQFRPGASWLSDAWSSPARRPRVIRGMRRWRGRLPHGSGLRAGHRVAASVPGPWGPGGPVGVYRSIWFEARFGPA